MRVWGLIGAPGVSRSSRAEQYVFVNRRPVENRGVNYALLEGYHTALMKDRYPVCCLFIEVNPAEVDVNIHPAKREVKFHRERAMRQLLAQAIRETLLKFHEPPKTPPPRPATQPATILPPAPAQPEFPEAAPPPAILPESAIQCGSGVSPLNQGRDGPAAPESAIRNPQSAMECGSPDPSGPLNQGRDAPGNLESAIRNPQSAIPGAPVPLLQVPLRLVGVVGRLYVVLESDRGLVLLDQHAAHERVLFEQMLRRLEQSGAAPSQRLLLPETVELPVRDAHFLRQQLSTLTRLGVGLSEFGERTFLLDALPPFVGPAIPAALFSPWWMS